MSELRNCPFCGSMEIFESFHTTCICKKCRGAADDRIYWNHRPLEEALEARVKELESELAQAKAAEEKYEQDMNGVLVERDRLADYIDDLYSAITGDAPEWSSLFGYAEAFEHIGSHVEALESAAVQWVTYTGEPETLPMQGRRVLLTALWGEDHPVAILVYDAPDRWCTLGRSGLFSIPVKPGDRWAYLPVPPEAKI